MFRKLAAVVLVSLAVPAAAFACAAHSPKSAAVKVQKGTAVQARVGKKRIAKPVSIRPVQAPPMASATR